MSREEVRDIVQTWGEMPPVPMVIRTYCGLKPPAMEGLEEWKAKRELTEEEFQRLIDREKADVDAVNRRNPWGAG